MTKSLITIVPLVTGALLPPVANTCDGFKLKNLHNSEFLIDDLGVMTKKECQGQTVYDIEFCVVVCGLEESEQCSTNPGFGENLCVIGTQCSPLSWTCERLQTTEGEYDESYDYSMFSSEFDQDLNQHINLLDYTN